MASLTGALKTRENGERHVGSEFSREQCDERSGAEDTNGCDLKNDHFENPLLS
jgi:hypothetical protein